MSLEEANFLKERAYSFFDEAKRLFAERKYDLSSFMLEQACQIFLKYHLLIKVGTYPRTHSLSRLIQELAKLMPEVLDILKRRAVEIGSLEDAYIASRYLPRRYSKEEIERLMLTAEELFGVLTHE
ncbi:MAG: HEPN domain-containing protein [Candidatus Bathyarchaeia archaeon]